MTYTLRPYGVRSLLSDMVDNFRNIQLLRAHITLSTLHYISTYCTSSLFDDNQHIVVSHDVTRKVACTALLFWRSHLFSFWFFAHFIIDTTLVRSLKNVGSSSTDKRVSLPSFRSCNGVLLMASQPRGISGYPLQSWIDHL